MGYAFISYSSRNQAVADAVRNLLNRHGVETWMAPGDIPVGSEYAGVINRAVRESDCFILLLSNDSQNSKWVAKEVERAIHFNRPILPLQLEDLTLNDEFELYIGNNHIIAIRKVDESLPEIRQFLTVVQTYTGSGEKPNPPQPEPTQNEAPQPSAGQAAKKRRAIIAVTAVAAVCVVFLVVLFTVILPNRKSGSNHIKDVAVGDTVFFGQYEQDNDLTNGAEEIEWLVLAKEDGKALLISKYALDSIPYNDYKQDVTWETCSLRPCLNDVFFNKAFNEAEQKRILTTTLPVEKNTTYDISAGIDTTDKVFLLSAAEAKKYFSSDEVRKCVLTDYSISQGASPSEADSVDGQATGWWWLRSPGYASDRAAVVVSDGTLFDYGLSVYCHGEAVRPAMWIETDS